MYGQQDKLPVNKDSILKPMNAYARSKLAAENLLAEARADGLATAIVRFSNVYGDARGRSDQHSRIRQGGSSGRENIIDDRPLIRFHDM